MAWQFERKGVVIVPRSVDEDDIMLVALDHGAEDLVDEGDDLAGHLRPQLDPGAARRARGGGHHRRVGRRDDAAHVHRRARADETSAKAVLRVIDALEDLDDVQDVYANFDIPDEILEAVDA